MKKARIKEHMNVSTLSSKKIEHKTGNLSILLYPNNFNKNESGNITYYARTVNRGVCTNRDIANDIVSEKLNGEYSADDIVKILELTNNAKLARVAEGYTIDDGINKFHAKVDGIFDSKSDTFSPEKHHLTIATHSTSKAKKIISSIVPVIGLGNSREPYITSVEDVKTKSSTLLTRGGLIIVSGSNIKIAGDKEGTGFFFVNLDDDSKSVKILPEEFAINDPSKVVLGIPFNLENGKYTIKIVTQYGGGKAFKKDALECFYGNFTVS